MKSYLSAITHFYNMNDVILNRKKIIKFIDTDEKKAAQKTEHIQLNKFISY